jgi:hypothetical protein
MSPLFFFFCSAGDVTFRVPHMLGRCTPRPPPCICAFLQSALSFSSPACPSFPSPLLLFLLPGRAVTRPCRKPSPVRATPHAPGIPFENAAFSFIHPEGSCHSNLACTRLATTVACLGQGSQFPGVHRGSGPGTVVRGTWAAGARLAAGDTEAH